MKTIARFAAAMSLLAASLPTTALSAAEIGQPLLPDWEAYEFAGIEGEISTGKQCTVFFGTYARGDHEITVYFNSVAGLVYPYAVFDPGTGQLAVDVDNIADPDRVSIIDVDKLVPTENPRLTSVEYNLCNLTE